MSLLSRQEEAEGDVQDALTWIRNNDPEVKEKNKLLIVS